MNIARTSSRLSLVAAALLLAAPLFADKVPPEEVGDAEKYAAGFGLPNDQEGPVPPNDACGNAIAIGVPSTTFGTTIGASPDAPPAFTCGTTVTAVGVWYTMVGDGNTYTLTTCNPGTNYDTKLSVYCVDCVNPTCVGGNDDGGSGNPVFCSQIAFCTELGATYNVLVHGFGAGSGDFEMTAADDGAPCGGAVSCLPVGACCDDAGGCSVETATTCAASGGTYQGDGTECSIVAGNPNVYSATPGLPIPDNDPNGITSTITVPDSVFIGDVNVNVTITHTFIDDLIFTLEHVPTGTTVTLYSRACGSEDNLDITIDDEAGDLVCAEPLLGSFNPTSLGGGTLSDFDGLDSAGDWTLTVSDNVGADVGTLDAWGLEIDSGFPRCYVDPNILEIPTLDPAGLALLVLLLGGGAVLVLRRRRRA